MSPMDEEARNVSSVRRECTSHHRQTVVESDIHGSRQPPLLETDTSGKKNNCASRFAEVVSG